MAKRLHRIILLHVGLVTCRFHYWKKRKPFMLIISGFSDVPMDPNTYYFLSLETPRPSKSFKKNQTRVQQKRICFLKIGMFENVGKDGGGKPWRSA